MKVDLRLDLTSAQEISKKLQATDIEAESWAQEDQDAVGMLFLRGYGNGSLNVGEPRGVSKKVWEIS